MACIHTNWLFSERHHLDLTQRIIDRMKVDYDVELSDLQVDFMKEAEMKKCLEMQQVKHPYNGKEYVFISLIGRPILFINESKNVHMHLDVVQLARLLAMYYDSFSDDEYPAGETMEESIKAVLIRLSPKNYTLNFYFSIFDDGTIDVLYSKNL